MPRHSNAVLFGLNEVGSNGVTPVMLRVTLLEEEKHVVLLLSLGPSAHKVCVSDLL